MASRLVSISKTIIGNKFYSNLWIAFSFGLVLSNWLHKIRGYFDLYWIIMKNEYLYFNLYGLDELSFVLFIRVFLAIFVFLTIKPNLKLVNSFENLGDI